jgi:hypothetical protein
MLHNAGERYFGNLEGVVGMLAQRTGQIGHFGMGTANRRFPSSPLAPDFYTNKGRKDAGEIQQRLVSERCFAGGEQLAAPAGGLGSTTLAAHG